MKRTLLVLCFMGSTCALGICQFDPDHQRPISLETPTLSAEVVAHASDHETGSTRAIRLKSWDRKTEVIVPLPFQFEQVNALRQGPAGKLIILGMVAGYVYELGVLDTNTSRLTDRFMCYDPAISPDGQYIAFTKFFPPHFVTSPADHSMLYVVARSPHENRPEGILLSDEVNVGFEVFPPGIGNRDSDNIGVAPGSDYRVAGADIYIWKGNDQYFFADGVDFSPNGVADQLSLVWVSIGNGSASVRTATVPVEKGVTGYTPSPRLGGVELSDSGVAATFSPPVLKRTFSHHDFANAGSVNLTSLPVGKP